MNISQFVRCLKKHALNPKISDENFLNALIGTFVIAGDINNKKDEEYYFDKTRTSRLLNCVDDVPRAFRDVLSKINIYEETEKNIGDFVEDYLKNEEVSLIIEEISNLIIKDNEIEDKDRILGKCNSINSFLTSALLESIKLRNDVSCINNELNRNGAYSLKVVSGDILKFGFKNRSNTRNIVVIPVDTGFHTHITREYEKNPHPEVSENTIHGQWLNRWDKSGGNVDDLPCRIRESIKCVSGIDNNDKYPIGTISQIESNNAIFYLIAIADFDVNNNAHCTRKDIEKAIDKLATYYDKYGNGQNIYIPLIGTGKSRASLSLQESYDCIVNYYNNNKEKIQGNITIVIKREYEGLFIKKEEKNVL